jgi:hypothetical protein
MAKVRRKDPMLALVRDPLLSRVDRRLAAILSGSLLVHIGLAVYAWSSDVPEPAPHPMAAIPVEYESIDITLPDFTPPHDVTNTAPGVGTPATPNQTPTPIVHRPTVRPQITTGTQIDPNQLGGFFFDEGPARRPTLDLGEQIREVREGHVEIETPETHDEPPRLGTSTGLPAPNDPTPVTHVDPRHDEPHGRVIPGTVKPETSTTLTAALVLEIIQNQYMRGLQRCYSRGMASEGALAGKVALEFTVGANGQVTDHSASGVSDSVESCIDNQMSTWRFPAPHDTKGNATDAPFTVALALQPS